MAGAAQHRVEPRDHVVSVYEDDESLVTLLADVVAGGLEARDAVVVIATPSHRLALDAALSRRGCLDPGDPGARGYVSVDAGEVLAAFIVDDRPDRARFMAVVGDLIDGAVATAQTRSGERVPKVRAFGEMVALLWDDGNVTGAIELESLWNQLAEQREFSLCCAYPLSSLTDRGDLTAISQVCARHSRVIAPASYDGCPARPTPIGSFERSQVFVPADSAVGAARRFAADTLGAWDEHDLIDDATVIVSELATNALQHARSPFQMSIRAAGPVISIAVRDVSSVHPQPVDADAEAQGGRGIAVVVRLSASWGTYATPQGKVVWSQLERSPTDPPETDRAVRAPDNKGRAARP